MAMYNAVTTQHNSQMVASAAIAAACARMLKSPGGLPLPFKVVNPVVTGIAPSIVPVSGENQAVQVTGANFQPNLSVDVFSANGTKLGSLSGTLQITHVTPMSFTMMVNLFTVEGRYGIEVVNPDGGRSSRYVLSAEALDPVVTSVAWSSGNTYQVTGRNFQQGITADVFDHTGAQLSGTTVSAVTSSGFTMTIVPGNSTGPFAVEALNPGEGRSNRFLFTGGVTAGGKDLIISG
jgi:hypothetical protein